MQILTETPADGDAVRRVHLAAFPTAMEADLLDRLRTDGDLVPPVCLVGVDDAGTVVGHVAASRGATDDGPSRAAIGLGPVGVLPSAQRTGVGSALVDAAVAAADDLGLQVVVLLGDPAFYGRLGFGPASLLGMDAPDPAWGSSFQARRLSSWDGSLRGTFHYAAAFDQL